MLKTYRLLLNNESGNTLILAVLVMLGLTALAISAAQISNTNMVTATNEKFHKANFFKTDADVDVAIDVILDTVVDREIPALAPEINVVNPDFIYNAPGVSCPSKTNRDVQFDAASLPGEPIFQNITYIAVSVTEGDNPGNANQIAEGYHGRGKGMAGGGLIRTYTVRGYGVGSSASQTRVVSSYQHIP